MEEPSTLAILDGLDESASCGRYILDEAKAGMLKLMMTSRPYGVGSECRLVDLVVWHKGLSGRQLRSSSTRGRETGCRKVNAMTS